MPAYKAWNSSLSKQAVLLFFILVVLIWTLFSVSAKRIIPTYSSAQSLISSPKPLPRSKYAYATILTADGDAEFPDVQGPYLRAVRFLNYQLLHNPRTRGNNTDDRIPLLVLVTSDVPQRYYDILAHDGATVIPVQALGRDWIHPQWERWNDVLTKLNLWRLVEYEKIMFLDADSIIFRPIDHIFTDPATAVQTTLPYSELPKNRTISPEEVEDDEENEIPLPDTYMLAGTHDSWAEWALQLDPGNEFYARDNYMNAGFFVCAPSQTLFNYYISLLDIPGRFDPSYPEQNLLNNAHRTDGQMPWTSLGSMWNEKGVDEAAYHNGLRSIHHKWWHPTTDPVVRERIKIEMNEMNKFYREREVATWPRKVEQSASR
ncbi:nucleotide-diphospho-sugar transferase [Talaromyces proteolyticus]|uniref:Nucleotide-diphospho-sugar transferase n=1 Tax=Talaromyces proteolyticus TaxID=1131652 RepID=A0AAD4PVE2_9EURO|nr:nucleotide-diphospho-sugar transferase [Talaromyces proteolyticus]KAH8690623.1 nucleotide-diphospho-sugar transferase [Talaromyces proteolyticus]